MKLDGLVQQYRDDLCAVSTLKMTISFMPDALLFQNMPSGWSCGNGTKTCYHNLRRYILLFRSSAQLQAFIFTASSILQNVAE